MGELVFELDVKLYCQKCRKYIPQKVFHMYWTQFGSEVQFSCSFLSNSLWAHGLQHTRLPCPSPTPGACSLLLFIMSVMPSNHLILCHLLLLLPSIFPSIRAFSNELALCIRWPKYWSFSFTISPSNGYLRMISFRLIWSPCCPRDSQESSPTPQFESISSSVLSLLYSPALTSIYDYWKNHNFD